MKKHPPLPTRTVLAQVAPAIVFFPSDTELFLFMAPIIVDRCI